MAGRETRPGTACKIAAGTSGTPSGYLHGGKKELGSPSLLVELLFEVMGL